MRQGAAACGCCPVPGEVFTEIDAIRLLTGAEAEMLAAGGVGGAEGAVWLALQGSEEQLAKAAELIKEVSGEISQLDLFL